MKYTIFGFQQKVMNDLGLDLNDAAILRWFVDFYNTGKMALVKNEDKDYFWVKYDAVLEDLPMLSCKSKDRIAERFKKLVNAGILEFYLKKKGGTYTCYRIVGEMLIKLLDYEDNTNEETTRRKRRTGVGANAEPKDSSIKNNNPTAVPAGCIEEYTTEENEIADNWLNNSSSIMDNLESLSNEIDYSTEKDNLEEATYYQKDRLISVLETTPSMKSIRKIKESFPKLIIRDLPEIYESYLTSEILNGSVFDKNKKITNLTLNTIANYEKRLDHFLGFVRTYYAKQKAAKN